MFKKICSFKMDFHSCSIKKINVYSFFSKTTNGNFRNNNRNPKYVVAIGGYLLRIQLLEI